MLRHLDLFSGIGGFALASGWAGFKTVGFAEVDPFCDKVLKKHWPDVLNYKDVRNIHKIPDIDLITGGFPCQPFSCAGKQKGREDERHLWPEFRRIIETNRPAFIVAEKVTGIIAMELDNIIDDLEMLDYKTRAYVIPACAAGAPHQRKRVWIVAHTMREQRCDSRIDCSEAFRIEDHWQRHFTAIQTGWTELFPQSWQTFTFEKWIGSITDTLSIKRSENADDLQTESQRSEWSKPTTTDRQTISYTDSIPKSQAYPQSITERTERNSRNRATRQCWSNDTQINWEENEPGVFRVDDGISTGMDGSVIPIPGIDDGLPNIVNRNKSLGNAIVPQVVYPILSAIALILKQQKGIL